MSKWFFTFGEDQKYSGKFVIIEATSEDLARKKMYDRFGMNWSDIYTEKEWNQNGTPMDIEYKLFEI